MKKIFVASFLLLACVEPLPGEDASGAATGMGGRAANTASGNVGGTVRGGVAGGAGTGIPGPGGRAGMVGGKSTGKTGGVAGGVVGGVVGGGAAGRAAGGAPPPVGGAVSIGNGISPCYVIFAAATGSGPYMNAEVAGTVFTDETTIFLALNNNGLGDVARVSFGNGSVTRVNVASDPISSIASIDGSRMALAFGGKMPVRMIDGDQRIPLGNLNHNALSVVSRGDGHLLTLGSTEMRMWRFAGIDTPTIVSVIPRTESTSDLLSANAGRFGFFEKDEFLVFGSTDGVPRIPLKESGAIAALLPLGAVVGTRALRIWNFAINGFTNVTLPLRGNATSIAVHPKYGRFYVADTNTNEILSFDESGVQGKSLVHAQTGTVSGSSLKVSFSRVAVVVGQDLVVWCL